MLFSKEYLPINFIFIKKILNSITHTPSCRFFIVVELQEVKLGFTYGKIN